MLPIFKNSHYSFNNMTNSYHAVWAHCKDCMFNLCDWEVKKINIEDYSCPKCGCKETKGVVITNPVKQTKEILKKHRKLIRKLKLKKIIK